MSGQTIVRYGDVILYRCLTRLIEQHPVFDATGTNLKSWRFVVHLTGFIHGWPLACAQHDVNGAALTSANAAAAHRQARWRLQPRQPFTMAVGCLGDLASGQVILAAEPMVADSPADLENGLGGFDVSDGPRCLRFDVSHISADQIFRVEAAFEIHRVQCHDLDTAEDNSSGILSHRWSCTDGLDANLRATRQYRGRLELATSRFSPHWFRSLVLPPLQPGMRRDQMLFTAAEDGRSLHYEILDQEIAIAAPAPARRWSVEHTEQSLGHSPLQSHSQIMVTLEGDSQVDKGKLILLAIYVITAKLTGALPGQTPPDGTPVVLRDLTITDYTGDLNAIRATATAERLAQVVQHDPETAGQRGIYLSTDGFQKIIAPEDLPSWSASYDPRLSASAREGEVPEYQGPIALTGILRCYLQTPCNDSHGINNGVNSLVSDWNGVPASGPVTAIQAVIVPEIPAQEVTYYSASHRSAMYTTYQMESIYKTRYLRAALPIASAASPVSPDTSDSCVVVSVGRPQARRIVRIAAERVGDWPEFPDPETMDSGQANAGGSGSPPITQTLLSYRLMGGTRTRTCNGEDLYRARFEAIYALSRAPSPNELLKIGWNRWSSDPFTTTSEVLTNSPS